MTREGGRIYILGKEKRWRNDSKEAELRRNFLSSCLRLLFTVGLPNTVDNVYGTPNSLSLCYKPSFRP